VQIHLRSNSGQGLLISLLTVPGTPRQGPHMRNSCLSVPNASDSEAKRTSLNYCKPQRRWESYHISSIRLGKLFPQSTGVHSFSLVVSVIATCFCYSANADRVWKLIMHGRVPGKCIYEPFMSASHGLQSDNPCYVAF
jgi:hypothetical protein